MGSRLDAVCKGWTKVWHHLRWVILALVSLLVVWSLVYVPKMQVPGCPSGTEFLSPKDCFAIENEARKTIAYILGGLLAIIGIILAYRRIKAMERQVALIQQQVQVSQEGQITERFTRAIQQLGDEKLEIRLGGIYALERIARDSTRDHWTIMEILTAYIRERAPWKEPESKTTEGEVAERRNPPEDIQAALTVLGRRTYTFGKGEDAPLDLRRADLRGANMAGANLKGAWLDEAHLERANLVEAQLEDSELWDVHLEKAELVCSNLEGAILDRAHLEGADISGANLYGASFKKASLEGADMRGVKLFKTNFAGANLKDADLERTDLRGAVGLTWEQLLTVHIDEKTIFPDYLTSSKEENGLKTI